MPNEFEIARYVYGSGTRQRFSDEANIHYTYSSAEDLINNPDDLAKMIQHHREHQRPRLKVLQDYYKGNNATILQQKRRKEEYLADHRATHNFAKYVSQFIQGYMVGVPLKTSYPDEDVNEQIRSLNRDNDADEHNSDLVLDQSIYGRAYELLYRNRYDATRFTILDVLETFVIYDDTVEMRPIAGIRYIGNRFDQDNIIVYLYTDDRRITYSMDNAFKLRVEEEEYHYFQGVPIIEYSNNRFRQGDFENVLNLIDLYDSAQSDIANYMQDLNDAMLKIVGNLDIDVESAKKMKENNILMLQTEPGLDGSSSQADADFIYKQYDVQGTEAYKTRIENDIHKFTNTPNLNDEKFSGVQSGESMKYKLFGLEQVRATKERLFKKSLRDRYRLINNIMATASEGEFDVNQLTITFTPNLPKSLSEEIDAFTKLGGQLSEQTKLSLLSFVDNPDEEIEQIEAERQARQNRNPFLDNYGFARTSQESEGVEDAENEQEQPGVLER